MQDTDVGAYCNTLCLVGDVSRRRLAILIGLQLLQCRQWELAHAR